MRVMIADGTIVGWKRVGNLVSLAGNVEIVGTAESAASLSQALDLLKPDVLIVDIEIGGRGGVELLRKIRRAHPALALIVLTSADDRRYRERCRSAGARFYFDKSTEFHKVGPAIAGLIRRRRSQQSPLPLSEGVRP
jgi:DNA-binding NarL/FixJ family response regulator